MGQSSSSASEVEETPEVNVEQEVLDLHKVIADIDAEQINYALSVKPKPDEPALISILCNRTRPQLRRIDASYQIKYDKSLKDALKEEYKGLIGEMAIYSMEKKEERMVEYLIKAFEGFGCDPMVISDVVCYYTNAELASIMEAYDKTAEMPLLERIKKELKGDVFKIVTNLFQGSKDETSDANISLAVSQAEELYKAGEKKFGTDEDKFIEILTSASRAQIQSIKEAYENAHKNSLEKAIKSEFSKISRRVLTGLLAPSKEAYIAYAIKTSLAGFGNDKDRLIKILAIVDKHQMSEIKSYYAKLSKVELADALTDELKGSLREATIAWISGTDPSQGLEYTNLHESTPETLLKERDTLCDFVAFSDALAIKRATYGAGTRDSALIAILCSRSRAHLKKVDAYYVKLHNKPLIHEIYDETSGFYKILMGYAVMSTDEVDAMIVKQALDCYESNPSLLPEVLIPLRNKRIRAMKETFEAKYGVSVIDRVNSEISGTMQSLIATILKAERDESKEMDRSDAKDQAKELHRIKVENNMIDEMEFIELLTKCSFPQLQRISYQYQKRYEQSLESLVRGETEGPIENALAALLLTPDELYATALNRAFKQSETDDATVARILGSHDKPFISRLAKKYEERYKQPLLEALEFHLTGHFRVACVTYVASADKIMPEDLKAIVEKLNAGDDDERMPSGETEMPKGRKSRSFNLPSMTMKPPVIPEEDVEDEPLGEISEEDIDDISDISRPDSDDGWKMTPELEELYKKKAAAAKKGNSLKVRIYNQRIKKLVAEQE
mmetsp:Transcript_11496/g.17113  ORF Transcript_11496/g.17113 Transcript_11496/m.17113 type:complete len:788 (+) Transcript_11496:65-2428(+)